MVVYFLTGDIPGFIKIGYTKNISERVSVLQIGLINKVNIIATICAGPKIEKLLFKKLESYRKSGEWFYLTSELSKFINSIPYHNTKKQIDFINNYKIPIFNSENLINPQEQSIVNIQAKLKYLIHFLNKNLLKSKNSGQAQAIKQCISLIEFTFKSYF